MAKGTLHVGWAQVDITPPRKTLLQGQFHARLSRGTISPLTATALALETRAANGALEQAVFLACDLPGESVRQEVQAALAGRCEGFDLAKLTLNATHTHNAPPVRSGMYEEPQDDPDFMTPDAYRAFLVDRLADAVATAWTSRQPGTVSRGFGYAVVGRCRRAMYRDGSAKMYGSTGQPDFIGLEACDDHAVNMLFFRDGEGGLSGILVNLACPSQCDESKEEFSADFWHNVRESIKHTYGPSVQLLPQCAPAGDASPHLMMDQREEKDLRDRVQVDDKGIIARRIMAAIDEGLAFASPPEQELEFVHTVHHMPLPRLRVTRDQYEMEQQIPELSEEALAKQPWGFERIWPFGPVCDIITRYEQQDANPTHDVTSHIIRLGDVVFATNPFELFMDYGARIRARGTALQTFLVQLADDSNNGFYLPTQRAMDHGHYSALIKSNWVGPEGGTMLVEQTLAGIEALFAGDSYPTTR